MKIGLFFGSFNPVHVGHLILASVLRQHAHLDRVWLVVSPQNPFKKEETLAHAHDRLEMVRLATFDDDYLQASDVEFGLPKPSYTIDTLRKLAQVYPQHTFYLIMGEDNLGSLPKWKEYQDILDRHKLLVYPRQSTLPTELHQHPSVTLVKAPLLPISATYVRQLLRQGLDPRYLVPDSVRTFLLNKRLYQQ